MAESKVARPACRMRRARRAQRALAALLVILFLVVSTAPAQDPASLTSAEKKAFRKIAEEWVRLGQWCASKELAEQARSCAAEAEAVWPEVRGLESLKEKAGKCGQSDDKALLESWEKKLAASRRKIAGYYDKLFAAGQKISDPAQKKRFDEYLWKALELCATDKRWKAALSIVEKLIKAGETDSATQLAEKALALKPSDKYSAGFRHTLDDAAIDKVVLRTASSHPIKYYFSLPKDFRRKKDRKWPVLICVDGAGSNFKGMADGYRNKRGNLPYMVVSPCTFANTNKVEGNMLEKYRKLYTDEVISKGNTQRIDWDEAGILAIIKDLQAEYDAESRVYITGFSGGGNATYMMVFKHPDLLNGAAPACGNFSSHGYAGLKDKFSKEDRNFPIHMITGEKDPHREHTHGNKLIPGIDPQTDAAERLLKKLEYPNCKRTMVPGMGHSAAHQHVIDTFKPYWLGKKKRGDKLD